MIDRDELLEEITTDDIIDIMRDLGADNYKPDNNGNYYFPTVCHGGDSYKLLYYSDSKFFSCLTCCGSMSLYDVVMGILNIPFKEAFKYVADFKGISTYEIKPKGIIKREKENTDLKFLRLHRKKVEKRNITLPSYQESILNMFDDYMPSTWCVEGISTIIATYFEIKVYINQRKAIIPHRDINGHLVGIRSRNFNSWEVDNGMKYIPIKIQGLTYKYPMNFNLYGLYQNKENIKRYKKVIVFESEKSVLLYGSIYGQENNIAVATCGMTFSLYQRDLLVSLGVTEIIVAYDMQYELDKIDKQNKKKWEEYCGYFKRLIKIAKMTMDYCNISAISCWDERINYKDSPIDQGKEIFEELYKERFLISDIKELEELIE